MRILISLIFFIMFAFSKILIVNSYDTKDQCGIPQLNGFLTQMYENDFSPEDFEIYFLNARVASKKILKQTATKILNNLDKYKYIITFDDAAFKLIGIPASKKGKTVIFSGMNYPYEKYKKEYNLSDNIGGVFEKLYIKEALDIFNKIKPINKIAIFYSDGVGTLVKNQILNELKKSVYESSLVLIYCKNSQELTKKTEKINKNKSITLFVPLTLSLKNKNKKIPFYKLKDIYLKNIKKPDISINMFFANMGFIGFGGVDFFEMGRSAAKILLNHLKTQTLQIINAPKAYYFINAKRAKEINFHFPEWFIKDYVKDIIW